VKKNIEETIEEKQESKKRESISVLCPAGAPMV
jgi:hypothetical protein